MALLKLTSDFVFCTLFTRSPQSLVDLLNSVLNFEDDRKIQEVEILPSEISKEYPQDKLSVLDIKAVSYSGELFNVEMQAFSQEFYANRALYYWAKLYSRQLTPGGHYSDLANTYSINFIDFDFTGLKGYKSSYLILEKDNPHIQLTDKFQMVFLELPKFEKSLEKINDNLELWLYLIKNTPSIEEKQMRIIIGKNPAMQKTLGELKKISLDPELLSAEEARRKARLDYDSMMHEQYHKGRVEGEAKKEATIALKILSKGYTIEEASSMTGLSQAEIEKLGKPKP